jgi:GAF domain-containing protein
VGDVILRLRNLATAKGDRRERGRQAAEIIRAARSYHWVGLYDVTPTEICAVSWTGAEAPAFPSFPVTQGLNGVAVASRAPVVVQDVMKDSRYLTTFGSTRAEAIFPIAAPDDGHIVGTIDVESDHHNAFPREEEDFLSRCADALAPLWTAL